MKILLGMCGMVNRTGAELFVRDLALAFSRRGHSVIVYAPVMGDVVEELHAGSIACVSDLAQVAAAPDVIIGNTQIETALCLARFPDVAAISVCHDRVAPHGQPPLFSRIGKYVAVDANCAERLMLENGIAETRVEIIRNGIDLARFKPRPPLPARPLRAAIFSNYATDSADTRLLRQVCGEEGIALQVIGSGVGNQASLPEAVLPDYDLVFAKARCAMEAMAVGCAVILLNEGMGMAGLVTPANVAHWHGWNFGRKLLQQPIEAARVRQEIRAYSCTEAAVVSDYLRCHANLDVTVDAFELLAGSVVAAATATDPRREIQEFARYVSSALNPPEPARVAVQVGMMQAWLRQASRENQVLRQELDAVYASGSWHLTAPLRAALAFWKTMRGDGKK